MQHREHLKSKKERLYPKFHDLVDAFVSVHPFSTSIFNYMFISVFFVTVQLHSVFLHVRKLRRMAGVRDAKSKVVKAEWVLNWVTFVFARSVSHVLITVKLIKDAPKFGKGVELPLALFGMAGMNLLNIILGVDLFNAFRREKKTQKENHIHHE